MSLLLTRIFQSSVARSSWTRNFTSWARRSAGCGELRAEHNSSEVTLTGWITTPRHLGGMAFAPIRDSTGVAQLVWDNENLPKSVLELSPETVVSVKGKVRPRPADQVRAEQPTGAIEVLVSSFEILNPADPLPFLLVGKPPREEVRLTYRHIDLRRAENQEMLKIRSRAMHAARSWLHERRFLEIETPYLFRATPEGAREFLVPTRSPEKFFALPQSPQQFKQMLIASGVERYFQVARCFRDELGRADRQPEFTQLDMEMAFAGEPEVREVIQGVVAKLWESATGKSPTLPFKEMTYAEAMARYGSDKPDTRFGHELVNCSEAFKGSGLGSLDATLAAGQAIVALYLPNSVNVSECLSIVQKNTPAEAKESVVVWKIDSHGVWKGPGVKYLKEETRAKLTAALNPVPNSTIIFKLGEYEPSCKLLGQARLSLQKASVREGTPHHFLWVHKFHLFEATGDASKPYAAVHHPFTAPHPDDLPLMDTDLLKVHGQHYDVVVDGVELGGGSVRIHDAAFQSRVFDILGVEHKHKTFGHLLRCLRSGCPPHAGAALGIDRLFAVALGKPSIRDVIAFPKSALGNDLMTGAPGVIDEKVLSEFGLKYAAPRSDA